jgi:GT2 family glycosyltransferase
LLWLNYNSMHLIDITKQSLDALMQLDYPNLEIILVDNKSSDGSREWIQNYLAQNMVNNKQIKFLALNRNAGFAGAINFAYKKRSPKAKYLAITHNDVVPKPDYLKEVVDFMEKYSNVGVAQGIVVKFGNPAVVDSSGFMMNEGLFVSSIYAGSPVSAVKRGMYVSMVEGTMPVYNLEAVKATLHSSDNLFVSEGFMYYLEDAFVSLKLWANNYKCAVLPIIVGSHYRMGTSVKAASKGDLFYYLLRNRIALLTMTNSRGKLGFITQNLRKLIVSNRTIAERKAIWVSMVHGLELGWRLKQRYGGINFYAAPFTRAPLKRRLHRWIH